MTSQQPAPQQPVVPPEPKSATTPVITLKWWHLLITVVLVAAVSVGCTLLVTTLTKTKSEPSAEQKAQQSFEAPDSKPEEEPEIPQAETSDRGFLIKRTGDESALLKQDGKTRVASWTLTGIEVGATCTSSYAEPPQNGHYVTLSFDVNTYEDLIQVHGYPLSLTGNQWQYYLADGTLWNGTPTSTSTYSCLADTDTLSNQIGASTQASGKIVFDLPTTDGILAFSDDGWRSGWEYPLKEHPTA
ncbi:hypothetical protein PG2029B_1040 [Bifidobacterium pseudolongum subsp. globosum]|uniref:DUF4352 domain-containing protein n=1 Tax=Bifidobacterium pseudolongum subsp. globosum TaxID=1690 RepID=A0A4Q5AFH0_9BIFI|nr:hypothetical protein [Bifidobacterium pseudolongum]RYQ26444.1 hypothetical protein PG2032B_1040 [Bifidobacterium pseudolongum subsp. globosum]RYQ28435.1 hypothetical protein PG2029B_1040 [Bifidobacterium pseudolongum subsp. globosum]